MIANKPLTVSKDLANKKITVAKEFDAPLADVWKAWTSSDLLDSWWAPKPWKAQTKTMDFREGGFWLYAMVGPDGSQMWARVDYQKVVPHKSFNAIDSFCDENGNKNDEFPSMRWNNVFTEAGAGTTVTVEINFSSEADLQKILEMGFEQGFTMALGNLDELLAK